LVTRISDDVVARYLARLDVPARPEPGLDQLIALHERHVERISYHNLDIQLGRRTDVDPARNAARLAAGEGGYCFHLNGSFAALLSALGFDVTLHRGEVKKDPDPPPGVAFANHLAVTVNLDGVRWLVDVGLGDGLLHPLPLRTGVAAQPPLTFGLSRAARGWRFTHDPRASFTVMDFEDAPATAEDFASSHATLSTEPTSTFVRRFIATNRGADRVLCLVDRMLTTIDASGVTDRVLTTFDQWRSTLQTDFLLRLDERDDDGLARLWTRLRRRHAAGVHELADATE
jgi:N-hydroxyarylamine O-acetyltransferase